MNTTQDGEYNQSSFIGGMNLLGDDSRLQPTQYRAGFDLTNRYDVLDPVLASTVDTHLAVGVKQELVTFGNYVVAFVAGNAYYKLAADIVWTIIPTFSMSRTAPRYWTVAVPVATTNYIRFAATSDVTSSTAPNATGIANLQTAAGASGGNLPGLLVQDNINQPQFIFLNNNGLPTCRTTQTFAQWSITFTDGQNITVVPNGDQREYVPIGNCMAWVQGILYIVSQDKGSIYRSVSGRPLDFVVNVKNNLTPSPFIQTGGGDATTTSYSVGVGGISCIRPMSTGGLFVAASNYNFAVTLNQTPNAPTMFGEYTFNRLPLFEGTCLSDRAIIDTLGDTRFIDLTGVRSFNAVQQAQNEGRNTPFTSSIQAAFGNDTNPIVQNASVAAAILYNNYELYAVNTIFGFTICKFDTINQCWTSFDSAQTSGVGIKQFAKIELNTRRLYAVGTDDKLYTLYVGPSATSPSFRTIGICSTFLYANSNVKMNNPQNEIKPVATRVILNKITSNCKITVTPYVNNRLTQVGTLTKNITYSPPVTVSAQPTDLNDTNTKLFNLLFTLPDCGQGWKMYGVYSWTGGSLTQFSVSMLELTPMNPLTSQENTL